MICRKRRGGENDKASRQNFFTANAIRYRACKKCEGCGRERVTGDDDSGPTRGYPKVLCDKWKQRRHELRVRHSQEKDAEQNERHFPLEPFAVRHARSVAEKLSEQPRER